MPEIGLAAAFLAGLRSIVSPCVLPMVPFALCYLAGAECETESRKPYHLIASALFFSAGLVAAFVLLNLGTTPVGRTLIRHHPSLSLVAAALIAATGLLRMARKGPVPHPAFVGMAFAFGWTPCVGPALAAVLWVAAQDGAARGAPLLVAYGAGMTLPFVLTAPLSPRSRLVGGAGLVLFAALMATGQVPRIAAALLALGLEGG